MNTGKFLSDRNSASSLLYVETSGLLPIKIGPISKDLNFCPTKPAHLPVPYIIAYRGFLLCVLVRLTYS